MKSNYIVEQLVTQHLNYTTFERSVPRGLLTHFQKMQERQKKKMKKPNPSNWTAG